MYQITEGTDKQQTVYGIMHTESGQKVDNITSDLQGIQTLVEKMNKGNLDVIHMQDVIDDYLYQSAKTA